MKQQRIEMVMHEQSGLYRKRFLLHQGLAQWRSYMKLQKRIRALSLNAMIFRHAHLQREAMTQWKESMRLQDAIRGKVIKITMRNNQKNMMITFRIWYRMYTFKKVKHFPSVLVDYHLSRIFSKNLATIPSKICLIMVITTEITNGLGIIELVPSSPNIKSNRFILAEPKQKKENKT